MDARYCADPEDLFDKRDRLRLVARSDSGFCRLAGGTELAGVVVYALRQSVEGLDRLQALA